MPERAANGGIAFGASRAVCGLKRCDQRCGKRSGRPDARAIAVVPQIAPVLPCSASANSFADAKRSAGSFSSAWCTAASPREPERRKYTVRVRSRRELHRAETQGDEVRLYNEG